MKRSSASKALLDQSNTIVSVKKLDIINSVCNKIKCIESYLG